ncbi:unnamed protein product [Schistosoma mattheei]|uniref:Uncharacterized protein n=1 Tax=Schistosoma mattheei TaxID=31246 RepID=A0A183PCT6_9TREM|nr:unnamed protein product [Schistosoma mattheei]
MYQLSESYEPRDTETVNEPIIPEQGCSSVIHYLSSRILFVLLFRNLFSWMFLSSYL